MDTPKAGQRAAGKIPPWRDPSAWSSYYDMLDGIGALGDLIPLEVESGRKLIGKKGEGDATKSHLVL